MVVQYWQITLLAKTLLVWLQPSRSLRIHLQHRQRGQRRTQSTLRSRQQGMVDRDNPDLPAQNLFAPSRVLPCRNLKHDTWIGFRPQRHQHDPDARRVRGRRALLISTDL